MEAVQVDDRVAEQALDRVQDKEVAEGPISIRRR